MSREQVPELTIKAVVFGLALSVVMGAANVYFGLVAGMTVSASIPAAVLAMGLFKILPGRGSILESNMVQTTASAGESLAAGVIFTMPALVLAGIWPNYRGWEQFLVITTVAVAGGLLGILFMIPMRKVFVVDNKELQYPEGIACSEVLQAGESAGRDVVWVICGVAVGALVKMGVSLFGAIQKEVERAFAFGGRVFYVGSEISPGLVAVGFIVGLPIAFQIFLGGAIGWLIALPIAGELPAGGVPLDFAWDYWDENIRYLGVGAMVFGGLLTIIQVRGGMVAAVRELIGQYRRSREDADLELSPTERNLSGGVILFFSVVAVVAIALLYYYLTQGLAITSVTTVVMVVLAFFFTAVASYIVGLVGNSNSPVSGMTITAVLATAALMFLLDFEGQEAILATLGVAGVVCCTACTSGDVCNDLKTGHLVGASPRRQQILQIAGVLVAAFVMWPVLLVLHEGYADSGGIGGKDLRAPQAVLFKSLTEGIFAEDGKPLPKNMLYWGAAVGAMIFVADLVLLAILGKARTFKLYVMPIAVGIYLPFGVSVPILLGGLVAWAVGLGVPRAEREMSTKGGVLLASGLIAGEALMGVGIAVWLFTGREVAAGLVESVKITLGLLTLAVIATLLFLVSKLRSRGARD